MMTEPVCGGAATGSVVAVNVYRIQSSTARPTTRVLFRAVLFLAVGFGFCRVLLGPPYFDLDLLPFLVLGGASVGVGFLLLIFCLTGHRFTPRWRNALFAFAVLGVVVMTFVRAHRRPPFDPDKLLKRGYRLYLDGSFMQARYYLQRVANCEHPHAASQARIYGDLCLILDARHTPKVVEIAASRLPAMRREREFATLRAEVEKARATIGRALREAEHPAAAKQLDLLFDELLGKREVGENCRR